MKKRTVIFIGFLAAALSSAWAAAPVYGPFSSEEGTEAFVQRMHDCTPTMVKAMAVTIDGEPAKEGDAFGAYVVGTDAFCGDGKAFDGTGKMSGVLYVPSGAKVYFKVWRASSGMANPEILTSDAANALTVAEAGKSVTGHAVAVKTTGGGEDPPGPTDPPEPVYGPFSAEEETEAFAQRMHDCTPTMVKAMAVTIDGEPAKAGDAFGAYVVGTDAFCGDGKAFDGSGKMSGVLYVPNGAQVYFKVWRSSSGMTDPVILTSDAASALTVAEAGKSVTGHAVAAKTTGGDVDPPVPSEPTVTVPFDDWEELVKGAYVRGADHLVVVGGVSSPKVSVKGLPSGLKFDTKVNWIDGTPSKSGVYTVTVTVTDKANKSMKPLVETRRLVVRWPGERVILVDGDESRGTVKGAGVYAEGKKVTLKATAKKGFVFMGWYRDGKQVSQSASFADVMGSEDRRYEARYITAVEDAASIGLEVNGMDFDSGSQPSVKVMCGVALRWPVGASALSLPTVKVSGLPSGLKFTAKDIMKKGSKTEVDVPANTIYGTPTKAKSGVVKVTVTTAGKSKREYLFLMTVESLPAWAVGTFDGLCVINDAFGSASMTVAAGGKTSGKMSGQGAGQKLTASGTATGFTSYENGVLFADMTFKVGSSSYVGQVKLEPVYANVGGTSLELGRLTVIDEVIPVGFDLLQNPWLRKDGVTAPVIPNGLSCPLMLPYAETYLTLTLKDKGVVKSAGICAGKKHSGSSQLLLLEGSVNGIDYNGVTVINGMTVYLRLAYQGNVIVSLSALPIM